MKTYIVSTILCSSLLLFSTGCDRAGGEEGKSKSPDGVAAEKNGLHGMHDGWWCGEHGIPEDDCAMCNRKLAAKHREDGDWCEEHTRPDSLCFKCHPENAEKFAAEYEDRYGEKPPQRND